MPIDNYDEWSSSYDNYIKKNNIKDGDFWKPFFKDLIRNESTYNRTSISGNGKGSYQGWYQLHKNELHGNFNHDYQHKKAFEHLNSILNLLTKEDLKKSREKGWSDFAFVQKMWNQGRHPLYYLYHNVHNVDGNGTPITTYGYTQDHVDISDKIKGKSLKRNDYLIIGEDGVTNMSIAGNRSRHILPEITEIDPRSGKVSRKSPTDSILNLNPNLNPNKLHIGDTIWLNSEHKILKSGGKFGFNKSRLVKNAEAQNKKDMRKKFIKSDKPTYTKPLIKKKQEGGSISNSIGDVAMGMIPVVGTYQDYKKFRENPTWGNFGWMAASAVGDALFLTGAGAVLKGIKLARAAAKSKALLTANRYSRSQKGFQRGLEYGASKGDVKSMFQNLRNYKVAEQKQLAAEEASRQQIIEGIKKIGKDLGQDSIINTVQEVTSESKDGSLIPVYKKQKGGIMQGVMGNLNTYATFGRDIANAAVIAENGIKLPEIKFNPDLFTSWNSIQTNVIETPYVDYQSKFPRVDNLMSKINLATPSKSDTPAEEREVKILPFKFDAPSIVTSFVNPYKGKRGNWVNDMKQAYRDAGIKNENAIRMLIAQDALESRWGEAAQGAYNFGNLTTGKSWKGQFVEGRDKDAAGNPISQKFRSYGSTKDYAADKIDFLKRLYDFDENDNIDTFLHKLQGGNKGGRSYAEDKRYKESVLNTYNSFKG